MSVNEINADDIRQILAPIWTSKKETARRVLQRTKVVMDWSIAKGYRSGANPVEGVKYLLPTQKIRVKHFPALPFDNAPDLMRKLARTSGIGAIALRFTILTVLRSGSVRNATWDQFSDDLNIWTIPESNMKSREEFVVPVPIFARDILIDLKKTRSNEIPLVFPSPSNPKKPISENTMSKVLKSFYPDATVHGMRSAFRDWAEVFADVSKEVKEYALAHVPTNKVESAYLRHQYFDERENLMEAWSRWVTGAHGDYAELVNQFWLDRTTDPDEGI